MFRCTLIKVSIILVICCGGLTYANEGLSTKNIHNTNKTINSKKRISDKAIKQKFINALRIALWEVKKEYPGVLHDDKVVIDALVKALGQVTIELKKNYSNIKISDKMLEEVIQKVTHFPKAKSNLHFMELELKRKNPNVKITNAMMVKEIKKEVEMEKAILEKEEEQLVEINKRLVLDIDKLLKNKIKNNNISYLQSLIARKYKVSIGEAKRLILNYDDRAYLELMKLVIDFTRRKSGILTPPIR